MNFKSIVVVAILILSTSVQASLINNPNNEVYWTNKDLGLDIMRLSYSDTISATGTATSTQASVETIDAFLAQDDTGWNWATDLEFENIYDWFDSDPNATGWTEAQNTGSSLFFELNGMGTAYEDDGNQGFSTSGRIFWYSLIKTDSVEDVGLDSDEYLRHFLMDQYADGTVADCTHPSRCGKSYHPGSITNWIQTSTYDSLHTTSDANPFNHAALLVRVHVPEPNTVALFSVLLLGLVSRAKWSKKS